MQEEAIRRVLEMQERAQRTARQQGWTGSTLPRQEPEAPSRPEAEPQPQPQAPTQTQAPAPSTGMAAAGSPLANLMQWAGGERGVLLALLALLMGEGADPTLLLALVYLTLGD